MSSSSRVFRLLRNNKEQGPFTSGELIQKGLKPYDLIWIDGRSAAWSYPGELPEFKLYVPAPEEQPFDRFFKKQETTAHVSSSVQAAVAVNDNTIQPANKPKPRYKVSAAWSRIQTITAPIGRDVMIGEQKKTPASKIIEATENSFQSKSLSWEDAWLDWEKEKNAVTATLKPEISRATASQKKKAINETVVAAPVLETKYSESLDSLKDKYIENILQQKKRSKAGFSFGKTSEFVLPSIALLVIFSIGYWLIHNSNKTASALSSAPVKTEQSPVNSHANELKTDLNTNEITKDNTGNTEQIPSAENQEMDMAASAKPLSSPQAEEKKTKDYVHTAKLTTPVSKLASNSQNINTSKISETVSDNSNTASKKPGNPTNKQFDPSVINNIPRDNVYNDQPSGNAGDINASENRPVRRRTNGEPITNQSTINNQALNKQPAVSKRSNAKANLKYVNVPEYVEMNNGNGSLKIENVSDVDLDLVVVDVQYYDASSRFRKGETLYLHNLRSGKSIVVKTPRDTNSMYATAKVSLVSSDAKGVYIVGDN